MAGAASKADGRREALGFKFSALLMEGAPPARQRALNTRGGCEAVGLDTLIFRWPLLNR